MTLHTPSPLNSETLLREAVAMLRSGGVESPRREARLLLAHCLHISSAEVISRSIAVSAVEAADFFRLLNRRCKREPLAYITGRREFWSLDLSVSPDVLIPRPESEVLVETALKEFPERHAPLRVLDLGTGSGCLLLAFVSERPNARGLGVDLSGSAVSVAEENARALSLDSRVKFCSGDWVKGIESGFDVVFANPPYIRTAELRQLEPELSHEPVCALDGGADGLVAYRAIAETVRRVFTAGAALFLEIGKGQADAVQSIFLRRSFHVSGTVCDLAGIPRCVIVRP